MTNAGTHEAAGGLVGSNPEVLGGKPVFHGTRVPIASLFEYLANGPSLDYFLESFPSVGREQAIGMLRYRQRRIEEELRCVRRSTDLNGFEFPIPGVFARVR